MMIDCGKGIQHDNDNNNNNNNNSSNNKKKGTETEKTSTYANFGRGPKLRCVDYFNVTTNTKQSMVMAQAVQ